LLTRGHKNLVWYNVYRGDVARARRDGFCETVARAKRHCVCLEKIVSTRQTLDWSRRRAWLVASLRRLGKPCGLFAVDDQLASEAIEACLDAGLRVPGEVSVVGVGNFDLACAASPVPLSSVEICDEETAYQAAALLDRLMDRGPSPSDPILIAPQGVIARKSSDFLAISNPVLHRAVRFMEDNYAKPLTMDDVVQAADVSRRTLYGLFALELCQSPAAHLLIVRMQHAKRLLLETDLKIGSIATMCGLQSRRNINRCFWRLENMSPRDWRNCHRTGTSS
jgi:LacI family transcriptional regulator